MLIERLRLKKIVGRQARPLSFQAQILGDANGYVIRGGELFARLT
jgi:hypothetical protein